MKNIKPALKKLLSLKLFFPIVAVIAIVAIIAGVYFFTQFQKAEKLLNSPQQLSVDEAGKIIEKVGKLIELPAGTPTVATVSDIAKLKDQPFFAKAQNGDKVLIYSEAKKAIIYRTSTNKIVEVSNVNLGAAPAAGTTAQVSTSPTPTSAKSLNLVVYNGTKTAGLAKTIGTDLESKFPNLILTSTSNASNDYTKTIVVDLSGNNKALAENIAKELSGEVGPIGASETKPADADILIILGAE